MSKNANRIHQLARAVQSMKQASAPGDVQAMVRRLSEVMTTADVRLSEQLVRAGDWRALDRHERELFERAGLEPPPPRDVAELEAQLAELHEFLATLSVEEKQRLACDPGGMVKLDAMMNRWRQKGN